MKYPDYDSPFRLITDQIALEAAKNIDGMMMKAVQKCFVDVDKDTLIEALKQDSSRYREAYRRGRETGYEKRDEEIIRCKDCKYVSYCNMQKVIPGIPDVALCTKTNTVHKADWFCADAELKDEEESEENEND